MAAPGYRSREILRTALVIIALWVAFTQYSRALDLERQLDALKASCGVAQTFNH
jgi:hypothetical protein